MINRNKNRNRVLNKWGKRLLVAIKQYIESKGTVATGETMNNLSYDIEGDSTLNIRSTKYLGTLDKGFLPQGAPYKPSFDFVNNIIEWMKARGVQPRRAKTGRFQKRSKATYRSNAYMLARSIGEKGWQRNPQGIDLSGYLFNTFYNKMREDLFDGIKDDIEADMNKLFVEINIEN